MDANIQDFLNHLAAEKGSSENTVAAYRNDLTQFHDFITRQGRLQDGGWEELTRDDLVNYILWLKEREYASATVARKVAAMKSFCGYLVRSDAVEDNPAAASFTVVPPPGELARLAMDAGDLRAAAKTSQGRFFDARSAHRLLDALPAGRQVRIDSLPAVPVWNSPLLAGLFVALLTCEWLIRRRLGWT